MQDECRRIQSKSRGIRRHHRKRIIRKFERIIARWGLEDEDSWAKKTASRGSLSCGCVCCMNPRSRHSYDSMKLTIQERKAEEDANDQLDKDWEYINGCVVDSDYWNIPACECYSCRPDLHRE